MLFCCVRRDQEASDQGRGRQRGGLPPDQGAPAGVADRERPLGLLGHPRGGRRLPGQLRTGLPRQRGQVWIRGQGGGDLLAGGHRRRAGGHGQGHAGDQDEREPQGRLHPLRPEPRGGQGRGRQAARGLLHRRRLEHAHGPERPAAGHPGQPGEEVRRRLPPRAQRDHGEVRRAGGAREAARLLLEADDAGDGAHRRHPDRVQGLRRRRRQGGDRGRVHQPRHGLRHRAADQVRQGLRGGDPWAGGHRLEGLRGAFDLRGQQRVREAAAADGGHLPPVPAPGALARGLRGVPVRPRRRGLRAAAQELPGRHRGPRRPRLHQPRQRHHGRPAGRLRPVRGGGAGGRMESREHC
mmetsp:Transcript_15196/g.23517  ORF Transcript_15196/g.23517 Transcript_15196/m.23517 type:complete len:352 (+) Transcript_15196:312-1367(+)